MSVDSIPDEHLDPAPCEHCGRLELLVMVGTWKGLCFLCAEDARLAHAEREAWQRTIGKDVEEQTNRKGRGR